ncbi:MAG: 1,5-anhydro-D-fructose reductase (1,5-anhydro-D-mannitol-forming) [Gammaproteobacteria bacterium]|jgi:1,5-anhydro-D-fructose reductase (1,5-anhydro-D-mannitol-forming)
MNTVMSTLQHDAPIRWGILGLGWVASDFVAPAMLSSATSRIDACLGSSQAKSAAFAQKFDVARVHTSLPALMNDDALDAIYIALPNAMHYEAVLAGAAAGRHMLCEKPFAMSSEHAVSMVHACEQAAVILRIAHQIRLDEALGFAREVVQSGRLGRLVSISLERASGLAVRTPWREDVAQSGVVFDVGVHLLDMIQWISGQHFVEVSALTHPDRRAGKPDDTVTVLGRLDGDCQAIARATREVATAQNDLIIQGDKATLVTSALRFAKEHVVTVRDADGATETRFTASPAYACEVAAFENELRGIASHLPDGRDSAYTVAVTEAVLRSVNERQTVSVTAPTFR